MNNGKERKRKFSFFPGKKVIFPFFSEKESYLSFLERKKTFYFFLSSFWERKDIFLSLLKLKKSFLSLLSFCRFEKIFLSFLFRNEKVIFLSRGKVFFLAHPCSKLQVYSICYIRIRSRKQDIFEKSAAA